MDSQIMELCFSGGKRGIQLFEPQQEKTCLDFRPGPTQTVLYSHRRWPEAGNFGFRKNKYCAIYVLKTQTLIC